MTDIEQLIERLSKATGPDRELGNKVLLACRWKRWPAPLQSDPHAYMWERPNGDGIGKFYPPDPTSSLDAAVTLVPDGASIHLHIMPRDIGHKAEVGIGHDAVHKHPAIALCIAALRARQAEEDA